MAKLRVAFLGCGNRSKGLANRIVPHQDVEVVALCDVKEESMRGFVEAKIAPGLPTPALFTNPAAMYAQARPDAVFIVTPHTLHFQQGMEALNAGCHVFMEKPMVTSLSDAYTLAAKVKETGKVFVIGYNSSCSPRLNYLRQAIREKRFGRLELVNGFISQGWMTNSANKWRQDPRLSGGGQAYDSGAHLLNSLCWSVESNVDEVFAFIDNHATPVDINSAFVIRFENGVTASIAISGNCRAGAGSNMAFMFENGRIEVDGWGGKWIKVFENKDQIMDPVLPGVDQTPEINFIDAIMGRAQPMTSPANGIIQSQLMDAIYESARTGRPAKPNKLQ